MVTSFFPPAMSIGLVVCLVSVACANPLLAQHVGLLSYTTPAYLSFSNSEYQVGPSETNALITIVRAGEFREPTTVTYSTQDGTAMAGHEYTPAQGTLRFPAGVGLMTFAVSVHPQVQGADLVTVHLRLTTSDPNAVVTQGQATLSILSTPELATLPALQIQAGSAGQIVVSWPNTVPNSVLEKTVDPASSQWTPVTAEPLIGGGFCAVSEMAQPGRFFYRLTVKASAVAAAP